MSSNEKLLLVLEAANRSPSADNSAPWMLEIKNEALTVSYASDRAGGKTFSSDNPATIMAMGALQENLIQVFAALNCSVVWEIPEQLDLSCQNPVFFKSVYNFNCLDDKEKIVKEEIPLFKRHTNRCSFLPELHDRSVLEGLQNLNSGEARVVIIEQRPDINRIAKLVYKASKIRFRTQESVESLAKSLRFENGSLDQVHGDGLDLNCLGLPPGGSAFLRLITSWPRLNMLNKLGFYKLISSIDSAPIKAAPVLVAIISSPDYKSTLSAGRLMEKVWIELNLQNIAVHPYYVISDQLYRRRCGLFSEKIKTEADQVYKEAAELFQLKPDETLQMLFRIGKPKTPPVLSKRLPVNEVCPQISKKLES